MTLESLILNIPLIIDLTILAAYITGVSAVIFGFYDILHLKWTGDLKAMITALATCSTILVICTILKQGTIISNAMFATYFYITIAAMFYGEINNPKLKHGTKPCKK